MTNQSVSAAFPTERSRLIVADAVKTDHLKRPASADLVLIPKQLRAEWLDVIGNDPAVSSHAAKVAIVVGSHFNRYSGDTFISQETIAAILDKDLRHVRRGLQELEELGYIAVQRRDLGRRASDGRIVCGGRGVANVYFPALDRGRISAMNEGGRLRERFEALERRAVERKQERREKVGANALLSVEQGGQSRPRLEPERRAEMSEKVGANALPTLDHPMDDLNPAGASACATGGAAAVTPEARTPASSPPSEASPAAQKIPATREPEPEPARAWASPQEALPAPATPTAPAQQAEVELPHEFAAQLKHRLGEVRYRSWFVNVKVCVVGFDDLTSTLKLSAPTRFVRDWFAWQFDFYILDAWNRSRHLHGAPRAERLEVVVIAA